CIRRTFGEKSSEFQEHRQHKLLMGSPEETQQSIALIKNLIAKLEHKRRDLQGGPPLAKASPTVPTSPIPTRSHMTLVPPAIPTIPMTMMQTAPITPPPVLMSVAMTTNPDLASVVTTPTQPLPNQAERAPEPLLTVAASPTPGASDTSSNQGARLVSIATRRLPQAEQDVSSQTINPSPPRRREQESIMHAFPSAKA